MTVSGTLALAILHRVWPGNVRQWIVTSLAARNPPAAPPMKEASPDRSDLGRIPLKRKSPVARVAIGLFYYELLRVVVESWVGVGLEARRHAPLFLWKRGGERAVSGVAGQLVVAVAIDCSSGSNLETVSIGVDHVV